MREVGAHAFRSEPGRPPRRRRSALRRRGSLRRRRSRHQGGGTARGERGGYLISANDRLLAQLDRLDDFYRAREHPAEAEATYRRALALALPVYDGYGSREPDNAVHPGGPEKPAIVDRLERFAAFLRERGARQEAEDLHRRALTIWSTSLEMDLKGASGILKLGDRRMREWYGLPRWRLLVPLYRRWART